MATFRNCSILSIHHLMTFFVILNKKSHVASKNSCCFDFALNKGRVWTSTKGVPLKHSTELQFYAQELIFVTTVQR
ncbi:hypothetical protein CI629_18690 [Klebsiella pneumoniae subsp. pneumoniae]|nr:hypothetical protein CRT36_26940 [Klebsiella pneumoniae]OYE67339.1 hypothetical protein CI627_25035 [Klebsiella pneumoniae subsp. pneumoniae]OYE84782.1 hypothetical protein CI629_18690 [Klebsiella pneumoniae subsp. pneumoniae]OYE88323.1 hypothetical protein CI628_28730 [Klebsiella pneumoniae subsp. pneumoniae]PCQ65812.1 hypothetical protein CQA45_26710 [Klebsiella pneumoniae]